MERFGPARLVRPVALLGLVALAGCGASKSSTSRRSTSSSASSSALTAAGATRCTRFAADASPSGPTRGVPSITALVRRTLRHPPTRFSFTQRTCVASGGGVKQVTMTAGVQLRPKLRVLVVNHTNQGVQEERLIDGTAYVEAPDLAARDGGKPWIYLSLDQAGNSLGINLRKLIGEVSDANPGRTLRLLGQARNLRPLGAVTISGHRVFGYRTSLDNATLGSGALSPDVARQLKSLLARVGATGETIAVYVTRRGTPLRIVTQLSSRSLGPIVTIEDVRYAGPGSIPVKPPPAAQTISLDRLRQIVAGG